MAHKAMKDGTVYEITGGKALSGGTVYGVDSGKVLTDGTEYPIGFGGAPCTVTFNAVGGSSGETFSTPGMYGVGIRVIGNNGQKKVNSCYNRGSDHGTFQPDITSGGWSVVTTSVAVNASYEAVVGDELYVKTWISFSDKTSASPGRIYFNGSVVADGDLDTTGEYTMLEFSTQITGNTTVVYNPAAVYDIEITMEGR